MAKRYKSSGLLSTQFATSCISTTLVLIMLGTIVMFVLMARNLSDYMRENINVSVLLSDDMKAEEIGELKTVFSAKPYVKSLTYISKDEALKEESAAMGTDPAEFLGYNPFTASFEININSEYANNDSLNNIISQIKADDRIVDVIYQKELMDAVNHTIQKLSIILLIIAALFTYISFALINNTVRLTIFSKRFSINTMKLVGASWGFIRQPFMKRALLLGAVSAVIADAVIIAGVQWMTKYDPDINTVIDENVLGIVAIAVLVFGLLITTLCTYASLGKYLRMNSNELYHV